MSSWPKRLQLLGSNLQPISSTLEPFGYNEMISMDDGSVNQQKEEFELWMINDAFSLFSFIYVLAKKMQFKLMKVLEPKGSTL